MKKATVFIIFLFSSYTVIAQTRVIKGKVTASGRPLEFATVTIAGTHIGATTSKNGDYQIEPIEKDSCEITISLIGYRTVHQMVYTKGSVNLLNIQMEKESSELNEVVVSGVSKATLVKENPLTVESVNLKQIEQATENNVIDAIAKNAPGFQTVKTGPNVSKPFINGLGYNRVLTLYDGMRVETQQWGDEHGVPLDDYIIEKAEVIEGPASLMYGSDAIAGVLSLFAAIPHDTDRVIHGKYLSEYQTNNGLIGNSLGLWYADEHWSWSVHGSERIARNYTNPIDGRVYNTGFKMWNTSGFMGYKVKNGYSRLNFTIYDNKQGIPDGSRDSLTRKFTYQVYESPGENIIQPLVDNIKDRPVVPDNLLNSYSLSTLSQRIQDYRLYSDNFYKLGTGDINAFMGIEQNIRREFNHPTDPMQAGEYIVLNTLDYGLRYNAPAIFNIEPSVGVNGMYQNNLNRNATDFPIPDYDLFDIGTYGYAKWKHNRWTIAGGMRYDHRNENGDEMYIKPNPVTGFYQQVDLSDSSGGSRQFPAFNLHFEGLTGSIGITYKLSEDVSIKANIARGYRAPNITEIASNGLDPGAHIVYEGNLAFAPEFSLQEDIDVIGAFPDVSFSCNLFNNYIQNYIYEDQEVDKNGNPVVIVPGNKTFQFQQTDARLYGINATMNIHPHSLESFSFNNSFSCVYGLNLNPKYKNAGVNGEYLPFTPPPRWLSNINYDILKTRKRLQSISVKAESDYNMAQNRYLGLYNTETATPSYVLFNISTHADIRYSPKQTVQLELQLNNVFNTAYQSHLSRLQYFEYYTQSPNGRFGIYNMGRNMCIKAIIQF